MNDTTQLIEELRLVAHAESLRVTADKLVEAAMKIEGQQKSIKEMAEALDFIYLGVAYIFSHRPDGEELSTCLKNISDKARTTLDASGVDLVEVARRANEESKS